MQNAEEDKVFMYDYIAVDAGYKEIAQVLRIVNRAIYSSKFPARLKTLERAGNMQWLAIVEFEVPRKDTGVFRADV